MKDQPASLRLVGVLLVIYACWIWFWTLPHWYAPPAPWQGIWSALLQMPRPPPF